jgi:hypothetical protein
VNSVTAPKVHAAHELPARRIEITVDEGGAYTVRALDRCAEQLTYEEMLGLVATLTRPARPRCLEWLRTNDQRTRWLNRATNRRSYQDE